MPVLFFVKFVTLDSADEVCTRFWFYVHVSRTDDTLHSSCDIPLSPYSARFLTAFLAASWVTQFTLTTGCGHKVMTQPLTLGFNALIKKKGLIKNM